jgi:diguanylate cyclase (GGDEF)-like protein/PAS domain S-box-containing protein
MPTTTLRNAYLACGAVLLVLYLLVPPFQGSTALIISLSGSSAVAILIGVRRNRPVAPWPWLFLALAQTLFFLGDMYSYMYPQVTGHELPFPSIGDAIYLSQYPLLMLGMLLIVRQRNPHGDRAGVLDALIITIGIGVLSWIFLMAPYVDDTALGALAKSVSVAYPIGDVLLVAAVLRLVFDGGRRPSSFYLLVAATATLFATDAAYGYALLDGSYAHQLIYDAGWIGFYILWGSAALDPTMRSLTEPTPDRERRLTGRRLLLLTVASVMAPSIEIVRQFGKGDGQLLVIIAASIVLFLLVIMRVVGLAQQHERAVSRERTLRDASAAFVAAVTGEDVTSVSRSAATTLVGDAGEVRICSDAPEGLLLVASGSSARPLSEGTVAQIEEAVAGGRSVLDPAARADLVVSELAERVTVFTVEARNRRVLLVVASPAPISPLISLALRALGDGASLALGSAAAAEQAHRLDSEARFGSLVRSASDLITVVDLAGTIDYQSPSIMRILGRTAEEVLGRPISELLAPGDRGRLAQVIAGRTQGGAETHAFECLLSHADGRAIDFEVLATDLVDDEHVRGIVLNGRDVSERKAFEATIAHQAFHDPVTGLPNRALFSDRVQHALTRADRGRESVGVIFLDLDDFKTVNDSLGHSIGDELLQEVGRRISTTVNATDTTARFGGDEFAVLLEGVEDPQAVADMAGRIVETFASPMQLGVQEVVVRPSLGIAIATPETDESVIGADDLVRNADAMHMCKRDGEGGYRVFEEAMHARVLERLTLRGELRRAIDASQFEVYFQPLVSLQTGDVSGVEALCRWNHPTRGFVQPDHFIPLAEETGLIVEIGRWVLAESCRRAVGFQALLPSTLPFRVGVNLSVRQLQHPDIVGEVRGALEESGLEPSRLVLEVTESVMMADAELAATRLHELRALGAHIALDDFGTGYSSLSALSSYPLDIVKIDRAFIQRVADDPAAARMFAAVLGVARAAELQAVAEGVEEAPQLRLLLRLGCEYGQGFMFAAPLGAQELLEVLRAKHKPSSAAAA